jgi:hypothetical protein
VCVCLCVWAQLDLFFIMHADIFFYLNDGPLHLEQALAHVSAIFTSSVDIFHLDLCSFNQQFHDVKLWVTLRSNIAMQHKVVGVLSADLSTPALHPCTLKNGKQRAALLTSRSCPEIAGNCLLNCSFEDKI